MLPNLSLNTPESLGVSGLCYKAVKEKKPLTKRPSDSFVVQVKLLGHSSETGENP